jgi:CheY-like chemotaxis protein
MGGEEKSAAASGAGPRVLLVDDEEAVRHASARVLSAEGFMVVQAGDGREALAHLERGARPGSAFPPFSWGD